tara:strand:- start:334 stop:624 length:291 start_codon:yes stop_codon:yes gene_type:complete
MEPKLIEDGVKCYIDASLKKCGKIKEKYNTIMYNILIFILFVLFIGGILFFKYKGKQTPLEKQINSKKKKEFIMSKINIIQQEKNKQSLITDIPIW